MPTDPVGCLCILLLLLSCTSAAHVSHSRLVCHAGKVVCMCGRLMHAGSVGLLCILFVLLSCTFICASQNRLAHTTAKAFEMCERRSHTDLVADLVYVMQGQMT